jgi:hypothetical protein
VPGNRHNLRLTEYNSDDQQQEEEVEDQMPPERESQKLWRMEQVLKYASLGYNQVETAKVLKISQAHVSRTLTALRKEAQKDIKHHIEETLPLERRKALILFQNIKRRALDISNQKDIGERDRIAALSLAKDAGTEIWAIESEGRHVQSAIKVAGGLKEKLDSMEESQVEEQKELPLYDHE